MERLTIPDKKIDGGLRRAIIDAREVRKEAMTIYWALKKYEDTELTPEQIMELKEAVQKLENIFGDEITVNQVIDFFVDFYIAQGDPDRVEKVELLTNEEAAKWQELKERDTAKVPTKVSDSGVRYTDDYICPNCGKHFIGTGIAEFCYHCGQRLKWEEL